MISLIILNFLIDVTPSETIQSIESRVAASSACYSSWFYSLHKPSHCLSALRGGETIASVGAKKLSIIHTRIRVLGGSQLSGAGNFLNEDHFDQWVIDLVPTGGVVPHIPPSSDVIDISDDGDDGWAAVIDLTEDADHEILVTKSNKVELLQQLDDAPNHWTVPHPGEPSIAYVINFQDDVHLDQLIGKNGKWLTMDGYIKKQVCCSR